MKKLLPFLLSAGIANAQFLFVADIKTVTSDQGSSSSSSAASRLFLDSGFSTPAPLGYNIWFVADTANNGVPTSVTEGNLFGADDRLLYSARLDGDNPGSTAGRFRATGVSISDSVLTGGITEAQVEAANVYVYLWNDSSSSFTPAAGSQFGVYNTGTFTIPAIGNAFWAIDGNINATQYTVSAVPEPETYAVLSGACLVGFALWRRRSSRNA